MKTKIINLNFDLTNLDGSKIGNAGAIVGQHLVLGNKGDALKFYSWGMAFHKGENVNLDGSDFRKLRDWTEASETLSILVKAQVLNYLDSLKEEE